MNDTLGHLVALRLLYRNCQTHQMASDAVADLRGTPGGPPPTEIFFFLNFIWLFRTFYYYIGKAPPNLGIGAPSWTKVWILPCDVWQMHK